ncbi:MAG: helix-turn-helix domain-containing protein [Thermoanaerobaculia bacterium]
MSDKLQLDPRRAGRFVSKDGDFILVRAPGKAPIPGLRQAKGDPKRKLARRRPVTLRLGAVREALEVTQAELANRVGVDQAAISRLEHRSDAKMSTVLDYLEGLGATSLELTARFDTGDELILPLKRWQPAK